MISFFQRYGQVISFIVAVSLFIYMDFMASSRQNFFVIMGVILLLLTIFVILSVNWMKDKSNVPIRTFGYFYLWVSVFYVAHVFFFSVYGGF